MMKKSIIRLLRAMLDLPPPPVQTESSIKMRPLLKEAYLERKQQETVDMLIAVGAIVFSLIVLLTAIRLIVRHSDRFKSFFESADNAQLRWRARRKLKQKRIFEEITKEG